METPFIDSVIAFFQNPVWIAVIAVIVGLVILVYALLSGRPFKISFGSFNLELGPKIASSDAATKEKINLNSGGIIYLNIVGFSLLKYKEQEEIVNFLDRITEELLAYNRQTYPPKEDNFYIWYKPGWGETFVFVEPHDHESPSLVTMVTFFYALALISHIQKEKSSLKIGVTIHIGEGIQYTRSGKMSNITGNSFNTAGRMMAFSDGGHFFISDIAYKNLKGTMFGSALNGDCLSLLDHLPDLSKHFTRIPSKLFESGETYHLTEWTYFDRNRQSHVFYNFHTTVKTEVKIGNSRRPPYWIPIERRDEKHSTRSPGQRFVRHLIESDEVCIVGLTHENTTDYLRTALEERNGKFWNNIQVVFPSERLVRELKERDRSFEIRKHKWNASKREIILFFESQGNQHFHQWSCLECDDYLSFWGNRFTTGEKQIIRIAPLIQGADLKHMPYLTFNNGMDIYNLLSEAFDVITVNSNSMIEWDILGQYKNGEFLSQGLASHSHLSEIHDFCKPVVLIMLYMREFDQTKSVLQKRTILNASDNFDTYSNITGHLCIKDTTPPEILGNFYKEITRQIRKNTNTDDDAHDEGVLATQLFEDLTDWQPNMKMENSTWVQAAIRELGEELRLSISEHERLHFQRDYYLKSANLYFQIYSLMITKAEFNQIRKLQPHASLEIFGLAKLRELHRKNQLNRLLQNKFDEIFIPIFRNLNISE